MANTYPIDGNKFYELLITKYGKISVAGRMVGFSDHAFGNPCRRGEITEKMRVLAEKILNISYEEYASDTPIPRSILKEEIKPQGESCIYCKDECSFLSDVTENRFNLSVAILPKRKVIETSVSFGEEDHCATVITDRTWVNYCPNCGRKL